MSLRDDVAILLHLLFYFYMFCFYELPWLWIRCSLTCCTKYRLLRVYIQGYKEKTKTLTRAQVRTIVQFLGEP